MDDYADLINTDGPKTIEVTIRQTGGNPVPLTIDNFNQQGMVSLINQLFTGQIIDENAILRVSQNAGLIDEFGVLIPRN